MKAKILRMDSSDISVYGEAKGEYTRQLCVFLVPSLESYFLELLEEAKKDSPTPQKVLWHFQNLLQSIPDWNQDKVVRETDLIQKDCKCDYLEELLTAVFIAHTKVLSAIRLTTKQKKLQITIPKIDHFLHRVLSDSARSLWTNAFLFADTNSIEKQKNLRQVSSLLQESVLQGIRGLLPVKSILREYLYDNDKDDALSIDDEEEKEAVAAVEAKEAKEDSNEEAKEEAKEASEDSKEEAKEASEDSKEEAKEAVEDSTEANEAKEDKEAKEAAKEDSKEAKEAAKEEAKEEVVSSVVVAAPEPEVPTPIVAPVETPVEAAPSPMIYIDTKPSVTFSQEHVMFDSDNLENNEIQDIPFAEAENREDELDSLLIMDEILPMDSDEILS
jgi:chemotaxis protein histidine kinase CheA